MHRSSIKFEVVKAVATMIEVADAKPGQSKRGHQKNSLEPKFNAVSAVAVSSR
jgi:hypothetical protein